MPTAHKQKNQKAEHLRTEMNIKGLPELFPRLMSEELPAKMVDLRVAFVPSNPSANWSPKSLPLFFNEKLPKCFSLHFIHQIHPEFIGESPKIRKKRRSK